MASPDPILARAFALLEEGVADAASPFHTPCLACIGTDGRPRQRTVVLRAWDEATRCLEMHTDRRSEKFAALLARAEAGLHVWDGARRIQLRVTGLVRLHEGDDVARAAWERLHAGSRATYCVTPGPGTAIGAPFATGRADEVSGESFFVMIRLVADEMEWLHQEQGSYARARFLWENGRLTSMWLVP